MTGYIYGVWHPAAPRDQAGRSRVKIGRSKHHPWRDSLDGRVRKQNLSLQAFGWEPVQNAFPVIKVPDAQQFERRLHAKLDKAGYRAERAGKAQLTEIFEIELDELERIVEEVKREFGI